MNIQLTKRLLALVLVVFLALLLPEITIASADSSSSSSQVIFTAFSENTQHTINISENDLTPQERQKLQAVRQRRNKEILVVLDVEQQKQLAYQLHHGSNFNEAIKAVNLSSEQRDLINAIMDFTNLKLQGIFSHHALLDRRQ
jgi:prolyl oligopeptidase PreP (S9A serine peptidase family)